MKNPQFKTAKEMASYYVGEGKRPNKFFLTIGFGWYKPEGDEVEHVQINGSIDSTTIPFESLEDARGVMQAFSIPPSCSLSAIKKNTITTVMIEDRLTGVLEEYYMELKGNMLCKRSW